MAATRFSYRRLRNEEDGGGGGYSKEYEEEIEIRAIEHVKARIRWSAIIRWKRVHVRKRLKIMKIRSLSKFIRKKARVVAVSLAKVLKRLKESQSHLGDLFAGNYLLMQVSPTPLKSPSPNCAPALAPPPPPPPPHKYCLKSIEHDRLSSNKSSISYIVSYKPN